MSLSLLLEHAPKIDENGEDHKSAGGDPSAPDVTGDAVRTSSSSSSSSTDPADASTSSPSSTKAGVAGGGSGSASKAASRASSRISARRTKQAQAAAADAERKATAAAAATTASVLGSMAAAGGESGGAQPLWRQLRAKSEEVRRRGDAAARVREAKLGKQQDILRHIAWTRLAQDLPPVFAILRGPTIRPYRMEELSLTLGRVTTHHRDVDLALDSRNVKISRVHARIVYDRGQGCYCIINLSKNGVKVKEGDKFVAYVSVGEPIPLPNPATIDIQGTLIYFQAFFISSSSGGQYPANGENDDPKKKGGKSSAGAKRKRGQGVTYSEMIQSALRALGGAATQPKITRYIQDHFKEDIAGRTTWRNSVSGVLSANPLFIQEAIISEGGRKDRKSLWRLKGFPLSAAAAAVVTGERDEDEDEENDEGALVVDEEGEDEEEEDEEDAEEAERPEKRRRALEEEEGEEGGDLEEEEGNE